MIAVKSEECLHNFIWHVNYTMVSKSVIIALKSILDTDFYEGRSHKEENIIFWKAEQFGIIGGESL